MSTEYSIIIPTLNRADNLRVCLEHISLLRVPREGWEVLVIDNGSTDDTGNVVARFKERIPNLSCYLEPRPGLMMGRHLGCEKAMGEILCYLDDDSFVDQGWLLGIEKSFSNPDVLLAGGPNLPEYETEPPPWIDKFWTECKYGRINSWLSLLDFGNDEKMISPFYVFGCNFNIRKKVFIDLEGSHPDCIPKELQRFQGDGETAISMKLQAQGHSALYSPLLSIHHYVPSSRMTLNYFCNRAFYRGVSDSFTQIRLENNDENKTTKTANENIYDTFKAIAGNFFNRIKPAKKADHSHDEKFEKILKATQKSYEEGKIFHRREIEKDPLLYEYVMRKNFMGKNGDLPI